MEHAERDAEAQADQHCPIPPEAPRGRDLTGHHSDEDAPRERLYRGPKPLSGRGGRSAPFRIEEGRSIHAGPEQPVAEPPRKAHALEPTKRASVGEPLAGYEERRADQEQSRPRRDPRHGHT